MNHALACSLLLLLTFALGTSPAMAADAEAEAEAETNKGCATEQCHPDLLGKGRPVPEGHTDCSRCHKPAENGPAGHPTPDAKGFILVKEACLECHPGKLDYDYLHPPVAAGDCQACHTLHAQTAGLLTDTQGKLLCYSCHPPVARPQDTVLHGDVAKQKCNSCHAVHGSFFKTLLTGPYSTEFFNDFDEKHYSLCFQCHKIDLLLYPTTSYNTNFRDGQKNLHYTHVNRTNRGRACKVCHTPHAGQTPKLINNTVSFGDWEMPLNFQLLPNGGQCAPGCHSQKKYIRGSDSGPPGESAPQPKPFGSQKKTP